MRCQFLSVFIPLICLCFSFEGFSKEHKEAHQEQKTSSKNLNQNPADHRKKPLVTARRGLNPGFAVSLGLAVFPGFGLGHTVQGRWRERGWIFTLTDSVALCALMICPSARALQGDKNYSIRYLLTGIVLVSKILQLGDTFYNAPHRKKIGKSPRFQVLPLFALGSSDNYDLGLSLKYRF